MRIILAVVGLFFYNLVIGQTYAIIADRLIDCKNEQSIDNPTIIVYKDKIVNVNFTNAIPDSATIINLKGYTVLPGLMDVHTHLFASGEDYNKDLYENSSTYRALRAVSYLSISLQNGFTTLRDVCTEGSGFSDIDLSKAVNSGFITGPRIVTSGKGIAATGWYLPFTSKQNREYPFPLGTQYVSGHDECLKATREQVTNGVQWIKLFADWEKPTFNYDEIKTVVDEANKYHVNVAAHAISKEGIRMAIQAGARSIEHGDGFNDSLIKMAIENHVYWCPTVTVAEYLKIPMDTIYKYLNRANNKKLKIVMGSDVGSFPWNINEAKELEYYVEKAGFTAMEAIKTATINAAELLEKDDILGQIKKNYTADIIAVKGNPIVDITLLQKVTFVMKDGKIYKTR